MNLIDYYFFFMKQFSPYEISFFRGHFCFNRYILCKEGIKCPWSSRFSTVCSLPSLFLVGHACKRTSGRPRAAFSYDVHVASEFDIVHRRIFPLPRYCHSHYRIVSELRMDIKLFIIMFHISSQSNRFRLYIIYVGNDMNIYLHKLQHVLAYSNAFPSNINNLGRAKNILRASAIITTTALIISF